MTDNFLKIRAVIVNDFILDFSKMIVKELTSQLRKENRISTHINVDIDKLKKAERLKIVFVVAYVTLYNAQRFFWKNIIKDEESALKFEQLLYSEFANTYQVEPAPYINDFLEYVERLGDIGETEYVGSKICELLGIKDGFLMIDIVNLYSAFNNADFYKTLKKLWDFTDEEIESFKN